MCVGVGVGVCVCVCVGVGVGGWVGVGVGVQSVYCSSMSSSIVCIAHIGTCCPQQLQSQNTFTVSASTEYVHVH